MEKILIIISFAIILLHSCESGTRERGLSSDQIKIKTLLDRYNHLDSIADQFKKPRIRNAFLDTINTFLQDSLKSRLRNCKVQMTNMEARPFRDIIAFTASFKDSMSNQYWMELDYPGDQEETMYRNTSYKLINKMPLNIDTVLSFSYLGDVEWIDISYANQLKIRILPFHKDFNFDSAKRMNDKIHELDTFKLKK